MSCTLGFNLNSQRNLKRLWPFVEEGLKSGHRIVFLETLNKDLYDYLKEFGEVRKIPPKSISTQSDLNVLFTTDGCFNAPEGCSVVGLPHVHVPIEHDNKDKYKYCVYMESLAGCDYLILGHNNINNFKSSDFEELLGLSAIHKTLESSHAVIIPGGYPPLDSLIKQKEQHSRKTDTILFSPTIAANSFDDSNNMAVLELVSNLFPSSKIIYAPYPSEQDYQEGLEIVNSLHKDNLFLIQESQTTSEFFACSTLLITDASTTAFTYSAATLRPHIQCQFNGKRKEFTRTNSGWIVYSLSQLEYVLCNFQNSLAHYKSSLFKMRNQNYANVGRTAEYIIKNIEVISKKNTLPNWLKIKRLPTKDYTGLSELAALTKVDAIPTGPLKNYVYSSIFMHSFEGKNCHPSDSYKLTRCSRSIYWPYSQDLLVFEISSKVLRFVEPAQFDKLSMSGNSYKFFLRCDKLDNISSFDFPEEFSSNFAGYINFESNRSLEGFLLGDIFLSNSKFLLLVSSKSMYTRFSMVIRLYLDAVANNIKIDVPISSEQFPLVLSLTERTRILPRWEIKELFNVGSFTSFMIWGCSNYYRMLRAAGSLPDFKNCVGFIDNNLEMQGKKVDGIPVYSFEHALKIDPKCSVIVLAVCGFFVPDVIAQIKSQDPRQA